jgi:signal transduction histidine kinase/CheY-like chemotaxis protein
MTEFYPSWEVMIVMDVMMIGAALGLAVFLVAKRSIVRRAQAHVGVVLLFAGLWTIASLYAYDFFTMLIMPRLVSQMEAMREMGRLHLNYSWYFHIIAVMLIATGFVAAIVAYERDVEAIAKARDDAQSANKAKSRFLSNMSHELRTPLNSILGFAQLMRDDPRNPADKTQKEYLGYIIGGGEHLLDLINQVLDLATIEAGKCALSMERVPPGEIIRECLALTEGLVEERSIQIIDRTSETNLPEIQADAMRFKQVLLNLLSNGIKYNRNGGLLIISSEVTPKAFLRIGVTDTGLGIPKERQGELFQPFNRLGAENGEVEGSGIGLALARQLVELMGGCIGCSSGVGQGSTFWVEFKLAEPAVSDDIENADPVVRRTIFPGNDDPNTYRLLYVEDNPADFRLMEEIANRIPNLTMLSAHNAELGLEMAEIYKADVIIMDINLPGMNGLDALSRLRRTEHIKNVPVIALSGSAMPADVDQGIDAGFFRYLTKPININLVLETIQEALQKTHGNEVKIVG